MVIDAKQLVDNERGLLDRAIFSSEEIYQQELEQIFGRAWLFIGHDSLVPNPNDFFLTYMGEDSVILTRDAKGEVHAFLNMCRHRGNRVARADDGNAKNFMCTYHGWTYSNDGKLVSVPGLQEAYYGELDVDKLGLVSVAQIDTYAGSIFATWDPQAPSLEDYLGDARWYMDVTTNRLEGGVELIGPDKWILPTNWKNPADNFSGDNYHPAITHRSATIAKAKMFGVQPASNEERWKNLGNGVGVNPGNGHGLSIILETEFSRRQLSSAMPPRVQEWLREVNPDIERRLGTLRSQVRFLVGTIFPNNSYHTGSSLIRIWHPRGPDKTEIWGFIAVDKAAPDDVKALMRQNSQATFGISGVFEQDDMDNWRQCTESGKSLTARRYMQDLSMGVGRAKPHDQLPGSMSHIGVSEETQRTLYRRWGEFMGAEGWQDIPVAPRTATYEGTATFKG